MPITAVGGFMETPRRADRFAPDETRSVRSMGVIGLTLLAGTAGCTSLDLSDGATPRRITSRRVTPLAMGTGWRIGRIIQWRLRMVTS